VPERRHKVKLLDAAVIGGGPAGIAAAVYLKRTGFTPAVFEKKVPGGLLRNAQCVENYPGFPGGISGPALAGRLAEHLRRWNILTIREEVKRIGRDRAGYIVTTAFNTHLAKAVIVATGTRPAEFKIPVAGRVGGMVFREVADMPRSISGNRVIIIGGGDAAFDHAISLREGGCAVTVVSRSEPCCLALLRERAASIGTRTVIGAIPKKIRKNDGHLSLECGYGRKRLELEADYLVIACGREPAMPDFDGKIRRNLGKKPGKIETNIDGLFFAGDIIRGRHRQAGIAVGDGILAAMLACEYLEKG
jgi:thioredoxin reductase (NADPH)